MIQKNFIVFFLIACIFSRITVVFPEEISSLTQSKAGEEFTEELRWLQEESIVSTVSRREQKVKETDAAVYVITQEDIRRSGANSIPEILRIVPGVNVARIDANKWAISIRGFNNRYADKLLVLIDGRTVYTPLFAGTYWDVQDTLLEDVERIEVIRGPGGALWGANAVNGIINIITKHAKDTQGGLVTGSAGSEERGMGGIRYGWKIGDNAYCRVYSKYYNHDDFTLASGDNANDQWEMERGGFRIDWDLSTKDLLTFQGDMYSGDEGETNNYRQSSNTDVSGGNIRTRWKHPLSDTSDLTLQAYYDRTNRTTSSLEELRDTFDLDFQHRFRPVDHHELIWGLGYRFTQDDTRNFGGFSLDPRSRGDNLFSIFAQDEISLLEDRVRVTLGSKLEHNDYTGFEIQPNIRVYWTLTQNQSLWAAVSRAVRTPSRVEANSIIDYSPYYYFTGNDNLESEDLLAYEAGYRIQLNKRLSLDIATFYNVYDNLINDVNDTTFENVYKSETYGVETTINWNVIDPWKLTAGHTCFRENFFGFSGTEFYADDPRNQWNIRSLINLPHHTEFDTTLYYVDGITLHDPDMDISEYFRFDMRLGWHITKFTELSLVGTNLLDNEHYEFSARSVAPTQIERAVYVKFTWAF